MASSLLTVTPNMLYVSWAGAGGLEFEKLFPVKILLFFSYFGTVPFFTASSVYNLT